MTGPGPLTPRERPALDTLTAVPYPRLPEQGFFGNVGDELLLHGPLGIGQSVQRWWEVARHADVPVPGFDPFADRELLRGYEEHADYFADARSPAGIESRKRVIDNNRAARERLHVDGGLLPALAVGALDPLNYIPLPGLMGAGIARGALRGTVGLGLSAQPTILANAAQDPTSTGAEYLMMTGSTLALGAAMGGLVGKIGAPLSSYTAAFRGNRATGVPPGATAGPAGATSPDALAPTGIGLERFDYGGTDAYTGLKNSPVPEVQRIADEIAGIPGVQTVGSRGPDETYAAGVGVETRAHWWKGQEIKAQRALGDIWLEYRGKVGEGWRAVQAQRLADWVDRRRGGGAGVLSHADFDERVGRAMHNNFTDTVQDAATPFVLKAANAIDDLTFKPMGEALSREGLIGGAAALWQRAVKLDAKAAEIEKTALAKWQGRLAQYPNSAKLQTIVAEITARAAKLRQEAADTLAKASVVMQRQGTAPLGPARGATRYAPRMWLWDKARDLPADLHARIMTHLARTAGPTPNMADLRAKADLILARIQKDKEAEEALLAASGATRPPSGSGPPGGVGPSTPIISAKFDIPSSEVLDYIETSATAMVSRYIRQTAPRLEMAKKFDGQFDMADAIDDLMERIDDHYLNGPGTPSAQAIREAAAEKVRVREKVEQLRDITLGVFPRDRDPLSWDVRAVAAAKNYQIVTVMGGAVVAALGDLSGVVLREQWGPLFRGTVDLIQNRPMFRATRLELEEMGEAAETVLGERNMALGDYDIDQMGRTWVERGLQKASGLMFQLNLLNGWTSTVKTWHAAVAMSRISRDARAWVNGTIRAGDAGVNDLRALGINKQTAAAIVAQLDQFGQKANSLVLPRLKDWTDDAAADHFRAALAVTLRSGTVTPGAPEKLSVQYTNLGGLAMQFMSFPISAQKRIAMAGLQRKDASTAQAIVTGISLGFLIDYLRSPPNDARSWDERLLSAVDRSGLTGVLFSANNILETASRDTVGIRPMLGQEPPFGETSGARQVLAPSLGPTGSHLALWIEALGPGGDTDAQLAAVRRSLLYQNLWYVRDLASRVQKSIGEAIE